MRMEKSVEVDDDGLQFSWGKKIGTGRGGDSGRKDVQFYESFTYDGSEYCLYDCVSIGNDYEPDSPEFFVGKIIKIWEHNDQRDNPRRVELLWFFKPYMLSSHLQGVQDVLPNELFLASGSGVGLTNENPLEVISGKCDVICISKDLRNRQPSVEEIKLADFLFRRTFDVGTSKISEKINDKIAGVDVKFIFNRTSCEKEASVVQKVATNLQGTTDSLKPNRPLTNGSVRQNESNNGDCTDYRKSDRGYQKEKDNDCYKQLARKKSTPAEERFKKDSDRRDGKLDCCNTSGTKRNDSHGKQVQDSEVEKQLTKQKSRLANETRNKDSYCLDDMLQKKRKLAGSVAVLAGRTKESQKVSHSDRRDIEPIRRPKDKVIRREVYSQKPSFTNKKQDLRIPRNSEGNDTEPATRRLNSDRNTSKHTEEKMLADANYRRRYRVFEVTPKPNVEKNKWFRNLPWEDNLKCAEGKGTLVLLQNLDPTYTSNEVENIVFSALNEQCTARMIERTSVTNPHIGEALVIFKTMDAAKTAIRRLHEGCLLLSNGRTLVATNAKTNPLVSPPLHFPGHIKLKTQIRKGTKNAVATSHCSQFNTIEFDMSMEWCLLQDRFERTCKRVFERQIEEKKKLRIKFNPKLS